MDRAKTTTPSAPSSRASTTALESNGHTAQKMTPAESTSRTSDMDCILVQAEAQADIQDGKESPKPFKPHQMLMDAAITVECGDSLTSHLTLYEGYLRCHSKSFERLYVRAKFLREQYTESERLMDALAAFVFPEATAKQFEDTGMEEKATPLILHIVEAYPLLEHRPRIKNIIEKAVEDEIALKNTKAPASAKRRDTKEKSRDMSIRESLPLLRSRGVHAVAKHLYTMLHKLKKKEAQEAKSNEVKAIAQHRLLLPGFDNITVQLLAHWMYQGTLRWHGADQLYALLNLATRLGVEALAETCLSELCNAAADSIQNALKNGNPLQTLLGYGSDINDPVLEVIFISVFKDKSPPERLLKLVIDTLAGNLDIKLWNHFRDLISHDMARKLVEAMIVQREFHQTSVKSESGNMAPEESQSLTNDCP
ncbi:Nn.00g012910.m01.CDS01 [Neocucurbitaria sp. VM-36]